MAFGELIVAGYKFIAFLLLWIIGLLAVGLPVYLTFELEHPAPLLLYLIAPIVISTCISLARLL